MSANAATLPKQGVARHHRDPPPCGITIETLSRTGTTHALLGSVEGSTTTTSYPPTGMASEAGLSPETLHLMRCLCSLWPQVKTVGGVRRGVPLYGDDHARGIAIDVMIEGHDIATGRPMVTPSPMTPAPMPEAVTHLVRVVTSA